MTRPTGISNRQANQEREKRFAALADFANLGEKPAEWRAFRQEHPDFFPGDLTDWMYEFAELWAREIADLPPDRRPMPPLLLYRNRLRDVWMRRDPHSYSLSILYGFDEEAQRIWREHPDVIADMYVRPGAIPGQPVPSPRIGGLPRPTQKVEATESLPVGQPHVLPSGRIEWEFACPLQQAVYEMMPNRWRMKVCPVCKKYFVAKKTAQKHCSPECYQQKKEKESLEYYHREGKFKRAERRESETPKKGKR